jgi:hypothetical protein
MSGLEERYDDRYFDVDSIKAKEMGSYLRLRSVRFSLPTDEKIFAPASIR